MGVKLSSRAELSLEFIMDAIAKEKSKLDEDDFAYMMSVLAARVAVFLDDDGE